MQVIATAGHVDHGKSTLVRALTGMEPDRWEAERRRGLTIDLGFAWLTLPSGERLAFVDVPGHERFVPNMLAGVGPAPAVMFVVAADEGWMPQSAEHLAAIDALAISRGLLAVTRADLADPAPALRDAGERIRGTSLGRVDAIAVSGVTGLGLPDLRAALDRLAASLPASDPGAPVRLWVDRAFSIRGSGTVVTGTLPAGTISAGDELLATPSLQPARVRGIQALKEQADRVSGVARVALNLRGAAPATLARGTALVTPGAWALTATVDVRLAAAQDAAARPPRELVLHIGTARTTAKVRVLGGAAARLSLERPLPLHVGDRVLLRAPGAASRVPAGDGRSAWPAVTGATVLDVAPPPLRGRDAAAAAARELASWPAVPGAAHLLRRHGLARQSELRAMGVTAGPPPVAGEWVADPAHWSALRGRLAALAAAHAAEHPLVPGMPLDAARAALGVADRRLVGALAAGQLSVAGGVLRARADLPERLLAAVRELRRDLAGAPFLAPDAGRLTELGLSPRELAAAGRAGLLLRVSEAIVLAPGADEQAAGILAGLAAPFTTAQARQALGTTRRVAIPLLEYLDRAGVTERLADDTRRLRPR
jgi:selenocysteine-specific elongation factor